jgi:hypothetical protein
MKPFFRSGLISVSLWIGLCIPAALLAQNEPESPVVKEPPRNGFQLSFFGGVSMNVFTGGYFTNCPKGASCPIDFYVNDVGWSFPYGVAMNIPLFSDAALYLRAGWNSTKVTISSGRLDTLYTIPNEPGELLDELYLHYTLFQFDLLLRLIGKQDGERIYLGPSFGYVLHKRAFVTETELATGRSFLLEDTDIQGAADMRLSLILGAEYAFMPFKNLYVIPAFEVDYAPKKISDDQPMRVVLYKLLLNVSYQLF